MASFTTDVREPVCTTELKTVINSINSQFGFSIPVTVDNKKIRQPDLSDEERCNLRIRPLIGWQHIDAVHKCIQDVHQMRRWNPQLSKKDLVNSLANFLADQLARIKEARPGSNAVQSFGPGPGPSGHSFDDRHDDARHSVAQPDQHNALVIGVADHERQAIGDSVSSNIEAFAPQGPREHWHSHSLPRGGLFIPSLEDCAALLQAPFAVRYECTRIASTCNIKLTDIDALYSQRIRKRKRTLRRVSSEPSSRSCPWQDLSILDSDLASLGSIAQQQTTRERDWSAALLGSPNVILSARLVFQSSAREASSIFRLQLSPISTELTSKRLFRKFGASRFLAVKIPDLKSPPAHLTKADNPLVARILEWLGTSCNKSFAGNHWSFLRLRPIKDKRHGRSKGLGEADDAFEALFFATEGPGLEPVSIQQLLSWFMPLELNVEAPFAKAYARLELGLSNTYASLRFTPQQVHYIGDQYGDGTPEDARFNDDRFDFPNRFDSVVMNDGCSRISYTAAKQAWACMSFSKDTSLPSAFQARIGPAKGVWMVETLEHADNNKYGPIWIELTPSQTKFNAHRQDVSSTSSQFDPDRLTFEILSWSHAPSSSKLYKDFYPIMEECGVSREALRVRARRCLEQEFASIGTALEDRDSFARWLQELNGATTNDEYREWPARFADQIRTMINAGFEPKHSGHLAELCAKVVAARLSELCVDLHTESQCSVYVLGVADPYKCLAPGEVHLCFSKSVRLPDGRERPMLNNVDALVARHPALRPSDLQKVRIVFRPELAHLIDVAVFPTQGSIPLAAKLQGGDYDGDKFWFFWESDIVQNFRNQPPPVSLPDPLTLGVQQDRRTLGEILESGGVTRFLLEGATLQLHDQLLGLATNTHGRISYHQNQLRSDGLDALADLHDLLVDSAKNGYIFGRHGWDKFNATFFPDLKHHQLTEAAWKVAGKDDAEPICETKSLRMPYNRNNIIDHLVFEIARPLGMQMQEQLVQQMRASAVDEDEDLAHFYTSLSADESKSALLHEVLVNLSKDLDDIIAQHWRPSWCLLTESVPEQKKRFESSRAALRNAFQRLRPRYTSTDASATETMRVWTLTSSAASPSLWDQLKASGLWCKRRGRSVGMVFETCGKLLCYLKSHAAGTHDGQRRALMPVYVVSARMDALKTRKVRTKVNLPRLMAEEDDDDDAEGEYGSDDGQGADVNGQVVDINGQAMDADGQAMDIDGPGMEATTQQLGIHEPREGMSTVDAIQQLSQRFSQSMSPFLG